MLLTMLADGPATERAVADPTERWRLLVETLADLPLGAPYALAKANAMINHQFDPGFALRLAHKDVELAVSAASRHGLTLPTLEQWTQVGTLRSRKGTAIRT